MPALIAQLQTILATLTLLVGSLQPQLPQEQMFGGIGASIEPILEVPQIFEMTDTVYVETQHKVSQGFLESGYQKVPTNWE